MSPLSFTLNELNHVGINRMAKDLQLFELFSGQRVLTNTFSGNLSLDKSHACCTSHPIGCCPGAANLKSCTPQRLTTALQR